MMKQCLQETRLAYLLRVAIAHIREHAPEEITEYDGTECDGACLASELQNELDALPGPPEPETPKPPVRYRLLEIGEEISRELGDEYRLFTAPDGWAPTTRSGKTVPKDCAERYRRPITPQDEHPEYAAGFATVMFDPEAVNPHPPVRAVAYKAWQAGAAAARAIHKAKEGGE